jgi:hypothetical protein
MVTLKSCCALLLASLSGRATSAVCKCGNTVRVIESDRRDMRRDTSKAKTLAR